MSIGNGYVNGLVPSGNKPLTEPILEMVQMSYGFNRPLKNHKATMSKKYQHTFWQPNTRLFDLAC